MGQESIGRIHDDVDSFVRQVSKDRLQQAGAATLLAENFGLHKKIISAPAGCGPALDPICDAFLRSGGGPVDSSVQRVYWNHRDEPQEQAARILGAASEIGLLAVEFASGGDGTPAPWSVVEPLTRCRAVTLAIVEGSLSSPALDIAVCCDLVCLLPGARLRFAVGSGPPSPAVIWALGRAGRRALARGLLSTADCDAPEAVEIGIAHLVLRDRADLPVLGPSSLNAVTTARDLVRSAVPGGAGMALELASFRLMFAAGDPAEGAAAFLAKRDPVF